MQSYDGVVKCFENVSGIKLLHTMLYVIHKKRKFAVNEDTDDHRKYIKYSFLFNLGLLESHSNLCCLCFLPSLLK